MDVLAVLNVVGIEVVEVDDLGRWSRYDPELRILSIDRLLDGRQRARVLEVLVDELTRRELSRSATGRR